MASFHTLSHPAPTLAAKPRPILPVPSDKSTENSGQENMNSVGPLAFDLDLLIAEAQLLNRVRNEGFLYEINFAIHYKTVFGEKIVVTGSTDWLGNWDPFRAFELEWTTGNIWTNSIVLAEGSLEAFEYKYVCIRGSNACRWEQRRNRTLSLELGKQNGATLIFNQDETWDK